MEIEEVKYIQTYASRLNLADGDLSELSVDERKHLSMLMKKYDLEIKIRGLAEEIGQAKLI